MVIMTKDGATLFETIPRTRHVSAADRLRGRARSAIPSISTACRSHGGTGGNTNASGKHRRPDPAARQRRRHHAEPARRGRARADHRLRRDRRFRRTAAAARRPLHLARRARPCLPPARWSTGWPARSRSTPRSIPSAGRQSQPAARRRRQRRRLRPQHRRRRILCRPPDLLFRTARRSRSPSMRRPAIGTTQSVSAIFDQCHQLVRRRAQGRLQRGRSQGGAGRRARPRRCPTRPASTSTWRCRCCSISSTPTRPRRG